MNFRESVSSVENFQVTTFNESQLIRNFFVNIFYEWKIKNMKLKLENWKIRFPQIRIGFFIRYDFKTENFNLQFTQLKLTQLVHLSNQMIF